MQAYSAETSWRSYSSSSISANTSSIVFVVNAGIVGEHIFPSSGSVPLSKYARSALTVQADI